MEVLILTTFVSLFLAGGGVALFVWSVKARTFDHSDRLSILPLVDPPNLHAVTPPHRSEGALGPDSLGPNSLETEKQSS